MGLFFNRRKHHKEDDDENRMAFNAENIRKVADSNTDSEIMYSNIRNTIIQSSKDGYHYMIANITGVDVPNDVIGRFINLGFDVYVTYAFVFPKALIVSWY